MERFDIVQIYNEFLLRMIKWLVTSGISILVVLLGAYLLSRFFKVFIGKLNKVITSRAVGSFSLEQPEEVNKRIATLSGIVKRIGLMIIWSVAVMIVLKQMGIEIGPILAGAGIAGLAVGFGAQNLVRDVISGFFIILENQIRVGDVAIVNGTGGLVEAINMRTVVLRDLSGVVHVFPNGTINTLSNMTKDWSAMIFDIGVAYKEDTDRVEDLIKKVAAGIYEDDDFRDKIVEPIEVFGVDAFDDSAVVIKARWKTKPIQQWTVGREFRRRLKKAFDAEGIEIPFPHRTVYWGQASDPFELLMKKGGDVS